MDNYNDQTGQVSYNESTGTGGTGTAARMKEQTAEMAKADMAEYDFVPLKTQLTPAWLGAKAKTISKLRGLCSIRS